MKINVQYLTTPFEIHVTAVPARFIQLFLHFQNYLGGGTIYIKKNVL